VAALESSRNNEKKWPRGSINSQRRKIALVTKYGEERKKAAWRNEELGGLSARK